MLHQLIEGYNQTIGAADVRVKNVSRLGNALEDGKAPIGSGQPINAAKTPEEKNDEAFAIIPMTITRINFERSKGMNSSGNNFRIRGMPEMEKLPLNVRGLELNIESSPPSTILKHILDSKDEWEKLIETHTMVHYKDPKWLTVTSCSTAIEMRKTVMAFLEMDTSYITSIIHEETQKRLISFLNSDKVTWKDSEEELWQFRRGAPGSGRGKRAQAIGNQTFGFGEHYLGDVMIPQNNIAAWRIQTGIMILSERDVESFYFNPKNGKVFHKGARGLKIMCGKQICQRTVKAINRRYNKDYPLTLFEETFDPESARASLVEPADSEKWHISGVMDMWAQLGLFDWISETGAIFERKMEYVEEEEIEISKQQQGIEGETSERQQRWLKRQMVTGSPYRSNQQVQQNISWHKRIRSFDDLIKLKHRRDAEEWRENTDDGYTDGQFADMLMAPERYVHMGFLQRVTLDALRAEFSSYQTTDSILFITGERWGNSQGESSTSPFRRYRCESASPECAVTQERMLLYYTLIVMEHDDLATTKQMEVLLSIGNNKAVQEGRQVLRSHRRILRRNGRWLQKYGDPNGKTYQYTKEAEVWKRQAPRLLACMMNRPDIASLEEAEMLKRCLELELTGEHANTPRPEVDPFRMFQPAERPMHMPSWEYPPLEGEFVDAGAMRAPGVSINEVVKRKYNVHAELSQADEMKEMRRDFRINVLKDAQATLSSELGPLLMLIWKEKDRQGRHEVQTAQALSMTGGERAKRRKGELYPLQSLSTVQLMLMANEIAKVWLAYNDLLNDPESDEKMKSLDEVRNQLAKGRWSKEQSFSNEYLSSLKKPLMKVIEKGKAQAPTEAAAEYRTNAWLWSLLEEKKQEERQWLHNFNLEKLTKCPIKEGRGYQRLRK